jgi:hypothetical protein
MGAGKGLHDLLVLDLREIACQRRQSRGQVRGVTPAAVRRIDIHSMTRRAIDRSEWTTFVDAFSRRHDGWLISVAVEEGLAPRTSSRHWRWRCPN